MTDTLTPLRPPSTQPTTEPEPDPAPAAGAVAVVVDGSVAAIAAAAWAARLAVEKRTSLLVVVLTACPATQAEDAAAALARVQPTLDRAGWPYSVRTCPAAGGATAGRRVARTARRIHDLIPAEASLLVCPSGADGAAAGLALRLAGNGSVDLLVVPDLQSLGDALEPAAPAIPAGCERPEQPEATR